MSAERIILLRHGRTAWNDEGRWQGHTDIPLDDEGRRQARRAAAVLVPMLRPGDRHACSDLSRARDTALAVAAAGGPQPQVDPDLREICLGPFEGGLIEEVTRRYPDEVAAWREGRPTGLAGAEDPAQATRRLCRAVLSRSDTMASGTLLVTCHGGAIRLITAELAGLAFAGLRGPSNCHWVVLGRWRGRWVLDAWNSAVAH